MVTCMEEPMRASLSGERVITGSLGCRSRRFCPSPPTAAKEPSEPEPEPLPEDAAVRAPSADPPPELPRFAAVPVILPREEERDSESDEVSLRCPVPETEEPRSCTATALPAVPEKTVSGTAVVFVVTAAVLLAELLLNSAKSSSSGH
jgi:hypothetical protein